MLQVPALYSLGDVLKMNQDLSVTLIWENFGVLLISLNNCLRWSKVTPLSNDKCVSSV